MGRYGRIRRQKILRTGIRGNTVRNYAALGVRGGLIVACLVLSSCAEAFTFALIASAAMPQQAFAYVDPSVMTYTIQAVAGVAVALSAVAGVFFRRSRKALFRLFKIDENANKEVDPPLRRIDAAEASAIDEAAQQAIAEKAAARKQTTWNPTWPQRLPIALLIALAFCFTVFVVPPIEIVGGNEASLTFGLAEIWWIPVLFGAIATIAIALILSAFRGRAFQIALMVTASITIAAYVQALLLNANLPIADGVAMSWLDYKRDHVISIVVWAAILAALLLLSRKSRERWIRPMAAVMALFIIVQGVGVASVFADSGKQPSANRPYVTADGLLNLSPTGNNVVVFVLDTFDNEYVQRCLADDPMWLQPLEGFTYFQNNAPSMIPTCYGLPVMLTGKMPQHGQDFRDYIASRYPSSTFLGDLNKAGWSVGVYSDSISEEYQTTPEQAQAVVDSIMNYHPIENANIDVVGTLLALEQLSLYRDAPWPLKPLFWFYTSDLNNRTIRMPEGTDFSKVQYLLNDHQLLQNIRERGLELVDDGYKGDFRFIHMQGSHYPYNLDAQGNFTQMGTNEIEQTKGAMLIVFAYLNEMRRLGVYDDATIIITGDHGRFNKEDPLTEAPPLAMLVKPGKHVADAMGAADYKHAHPSDWGLAVSDMPTEHVDMLPTVIAAIGGDPAPYGPTVYQVDDPNRKRIYINTLPYNNIDHDLIEYELVGVVNDLANWVPTGYMWEKRGW